MRSQKQMTLSVPEGTGLGRYLDVERGSKTSAMVGSADAEGQGQSFETQPVRLQLGAMVSVLRCKRGEMASKLRANSSSSRMGAGYGEVDA
jgi:hypothetical protein